MSTPDTVSRLSPDALRAAAAKADATSHVLHFIASHARALPPPPPAELPLASLATYRVPKPVAAGKCSAKPNDLDPEPFNLVATCGLLPDAAPGSEMDDVWRSHGVYRRLYALRCVVEMLAQETGAEWVGLYRVVPSPPGSALVKEAYVGAASRALFPLTPEFAAHSNNSTVAMSGDGMHLPDVAGLDDDVPYYACDARVQSELCLPITTPEGKVIGIMDAEAWRPRHFTPDRLALCAAVCQLLGQNGLWVDTAHAVTTESDV